MLKKGFNGDVAAFYGRIVPCSADSSYGYRKTPQAPILKNGADVN